MLAIAGALGALSRYYLSGLVQSFASPGYPWGTFAVNAIGCLLFGLVWTLGEDRIVIGNQFRVVVLAGFMGAFTTFSTFAFEVEQMIQESQWFNAMTYIVVQNSLGLACIFAGLSMGRWIVARV